MPPPFPIQIAGGGLAGLTLGIALRRQDVPVTIFEAGRYPRHRVCGEFINGRGVEVLETLGLKGKFFAAGALIAETAAFFIGRSQSPARRLPRPAVCLSRFVMDELLAAEFQRLGGDLRLGSRWQNDFGEGVVRATGRRLHSPADGCHWFGLKAHAANVSLAADLEMHLLDNGYLGICRLAGGKVDICGLFRRTGRAELPGNIFELIRGKPGTILHDRLARAKFDDESFCSVAGLSLKPRRVLNQDEICLGDAITMIPPVTGNGMSLAFESAQLAADPLTAFSAGKCSWPEARRRIAGLCDERFSRRLFWAQQLQQILLSPSRRTLLFHLVSRSDWIWRMTFERTR